MTLIGGFGNIFKNLVNHRLLICLLDQISELVIHSLFWIKLQFNVLTLSLFFCIIQKHETNKTRMI